MLTEIGAHASRAHCRVYPSGLTDAQWAAIAPMIPDAAPGGRPRKADKREIVEALRRWWGGTTCEAQTP